MKDDDVKQKKLKNGDIVLIFPRDREIQECIDFANKKALNPFILGETYYGKPRFVCAYSWRLDYFNKYKEWPEG